MKAQLALFALSTSIGCGPPVPEPDASDVPVAAVRFEPAADAAQVANVIHVHISNTNATSVFLFRGTLTSYYLGKLKGESLPETLLARQVPLMTWRTDSELIAVPLQALSVGSYSLAANTGLLSEFKVTTSLPLLSRLWPPASSTASPRFAIYCSESIARAGLPLEESLILQPRQLTVLLAKGVDDAGTFADRCLHFASDVTLDSAELLIPPPVVGAWALRPLRFTGSEPRSAVPLACDAEESAFGSGCAAAADDRVEVRTPDAPLLWVVHTDHGSLVQVTEGGAALVINGLSPASSEHVWGVVRDETGATRDFDVELRTAAARERPILNEALADALGPEPASEWVELFNDGTLAVDLAKYSFQDSGGRIPLPHAVLAAKSYALLVREDYAPNGSDEPAAAGALLVRVPALGKSGLSNSGERLALVDAAGQEQSVLPALTGMPGQSLARRSPASPDNEPSSFSLAVPTPGGPNRVASTASE